MYSYLLKEKSWFILFKKKKKNREGMKRSTRLGKDQHKIFIQIK